MYRKQPVGVLGTVDRTKVKGGHGTVCIVGSDRRKLRKSGIQAKMRKERHDSGGGGGLIYSTERGRMCAICLQPIVGCTCTRAAPIAAGDGVVRVGRETKGRKGAGVTVVTGVPLAPDELAALGTQLKKRCGSGGTVRDDGVIEIQGDHRDALVTELQKRGWTVKRVGG
jgi:translation initiation factor 1